MDSLPPPWVLLQPLQGLLKGRPIPGHLEPRLAHEVDVVRVAVEAPGEFLDGEELGVVVLEHGGIFILAPRVQVHPYKGV